MTLKLARAGVEAVSGAEGLGLTQQIVEIPLSGKGEAALQDAIKAARQLGEPAAPARLGACLLWPAAARGGSRHACLPFSGADTVPATPALLSFPPVAGVPYSVGTEHLLLGMLREEKGPVVRMLAKLGADVAQVQAEVRRLADCLPCGMGPGRNLHCCATVIHEGRGVLRSGSVCAEKRLTRSPEERLLPLPQPPEARCPGFPRGRCCG